MSTMLALRTQKLIQDVKPNAVMVMADPQWWDTAKLLQYVDSQEEFSHYNKHLDKYSGPTSFFYWYPQRANFFKAKWYSCLAMFNLHYRIPSHWGFYKPGLEIKFALEEAEKLGSNIYFMGPMLNANSWNRLRHETRLWFTHYLYKRVEYYGNMFWAHERSEMNARVQNS